MTFLWMDRTSYYALHKFNMSSERLYRYIHQPSKHKQANADSSEFSILSVVYKIGELIIELLKYLLRRVD